MTSYDESWLPLACARCARNGARQTLYLMLAVIAPQAIENTASGHLGWRDVLGVSAVAVIGWRTLRMPLVAAHSDACLARQPTRFQRWIYRWLIRPAVYVVYKMIYTLARLLLDAWWLIRDALARCYPHR